MSKTPPIVYQVAGRVEVLPIRQLIARFGRPAHAWSAGDQARWEAASSTSAVQAFDPAENDRLVGLMLYDVRRRHLGILHVLVDEEYRRRGIASRMTWHLTHWPNHTRYPSVSTMCPDNNDAAISWLRHCDFRAISVLPNYGEGRDFYLFSWQRKRDDEAVSVSGGRSDDGRPISHCRKAGPPSDN